MSPNALFSPNGHGEHAALNRLYIMACDSVSGSLPRALPQEHLRPTFDL